MTSLAVLALFGLAYGLVLQGSRFCFARAAYELFLLRSRDALDGVMAGLVVGAAGFGVVALVSAHLGGAASSHALVLPTGAATACGALVFGMGMSLAGMCASGTLQRMGEGYLVAWLTLAGIIVGAALDPVRSFPLAASPRLSLGQWIGPSAGSLLTVVALVVMWLAISRRKSIFTAASPDVAEMGSGEPGRRSLRSRFATPVVGGALLGVLNTVQFAFVMPWTVGYPLALIPSLWTGGSSEVRVSQVLPLLVLDAAMVLGALIAAAAQRSLRLRRPRRWGEAARALAGGLLMGLGIKVAHGCNVGGIFSAIPSLSVSGWLYLPAMLVGAWLGIKLVSKWA